MGYVWGRINVKFCLAKSNILSLIQSLSKRRHILQILAHNLFLDLWSSRPSEQRSLTTRFYSILSWTKTTLLSSMWILLRILFRWRHCGQVKAHVQGCIENAIVSFVWISFEKSSACKIACLKKKTFVCIYSRILYIINLIESIGRQGDDMIYHIILFCSAAH